MCETCQSYIKRVKLQNKPYIKFNQYQIENQYGINKEVRVFNKNHFSNSKFF